MVSKSCSRIFYWLTNCLILSDKRNLTIAEATGLIFLLNNVASAWEVHFANCCTYNAFYMDLPLPSFVSHSSLLIAKIVDFVVGMVMAFIHIEIIHNFYSNYLRFFSNNCWFVLLYNGLNIVSNKISSFQMITSAIVLMHYVRIQQQ